MHHKDLEKLCLRRWIVVVVQERKFIRRELNQTLSLFLHHRHPEETRRPVFFLLVQNLTIDEELGYSQPQSRVFLLCRRARAPSILESALLLSSTGIFKKATTTTVK